MTSTEGDQFVGIYPDNGISKLLLGPTPFDHLQYGYSIPEASAVMFIGIAGASC
jgi:hypothetical protein